RDPAAGVFDGFCANDLVIRSQGDINGDGAVGMVDFLLMLDQWGPCSNCANCSADLDGDCEVGVVDFLILLRHWG
ncbi:MAG: dockerin type I domain-containing protein, partial [Planctomycetota bacterium]